MVNVYVQSPKWFVRPRNTDWRYTRFVIPRISEFAPECRFSLSDSNLTLFHANRRYLRNVFCRKLGLSIRHDSGSVLDLNEFKRSGCDIVFSHDDYTRNVGSIPVVWHNSILDPEMVRTLGYSEETIVEENTIKMKGFQQARIVMRIH